jgi:hypothetical protein
LFPFQFSYPEESKMKMKIEPPPIHWHDNQCPQDSDIGRGWGLQLL